MEAAELGLFMVSACAVTALVEHPASPVRANVADPFVRRVLIGVAMGLTAIVLILSPMGKRSGAHFNPSVTLAFLRLGKVRPADALGYVAAQVAGGVAGVVVARMLLGGLLADPAVNFAVTVPGPQGAGVAFAAELGISFLQMSIVLACLAVPRLAPFTPFVAGTMVAAYIAFEAPLSGMSMNPARTLGSAVSAQVWTALWVYLTAPLAGMLLATVVHERVRAFGAAPCAKLRHDAAYRCIFCGDRG